MLGGPPEPVEDTAPTFGSRWDRVTYLLAAYRVPLSVVTAATIIAYAAFDASVPTPPAWLVEFSVPAGLLAFPAFMAWKTVARRVIAANSVKVIEHNGPLKDDRAFQIPPRTWDDRESGTLDAYQPPGGEVWVVSELEWMEDTEQLHVEGVWPSIADPNAVYKSQVRFDRIFIDLLKELMKAQAFSATVSQKGVEIYDESTKEQIMMIEEGVLPDGVDAAEKIEELEDEIEGTLDIESIGEMQTDDTNDRIDTQDMQTGGPRDAGPNPGGEQ